MPHMSILVIKNEIAKQFYNDKINGKHKVDVILGGGSKYFGKDNGNLDQKFKKMVTMWFLIK